MSKSKLNNLTKADIVDILVHGRDDDEEDETNGDVQRTLTQLLRDIASLREEVREAREGQGQKIETMQKSIDGLKAQLGEQSRIQSQQQKYLEKIDDEKRQNNIVITGVPEGTALGQATDDNAKVKVILEKMDAKDLAGEYDFTRLGDARAGRTRPILLRLHEANKRRPVLERSKKLKEAGEAFAKIFVKKDTHPSVRKEWKRLSDVEKAEKAKPENAGHAITFNRKLRQIMRDGVVIDSWSKTSF